MHHPKTPAAFLFITTLLFTLSAAPARAGTPLVTSLTASPSLISNALTTLISWTTDGATGHDILFPCIDGVNIQNSASTNITCGVRQSVSTNASDQAAFTFTNISGTTKLITATVFPKDLDGYDYDAGARTVDINVGTASQPITNFSLSSTSIASGGSVTLTWTGQYIMGANMSFSCNDNVSVYPQGSTSKIICGVPAVTTSGLVTEPPPSGSMTYTLVNSSPTDAMHINVSVFPAIHTGSYDATHGLTIPLTIAPKAPAPVPSVNYFLKLGTSTPVFGVPFSLGWSANNTSGVNLQFSCDPDLTTTAGTTTLPCNTPAFAAPLSASSTATFTITSKYGLPAFPSVLLFPQFADGTYSGINAPKIVLGIAATSTLSPHPNLLPVTIPPLGGGRPGGGSTGEGATPSTQTTAPTPAPTVKKVTIPRLTSPLTRGSHGAQVTALQTFLATDPTLYPEGSVTGFFGPATEAAVKRFQLKYNVTTAINPSYGFVGPATRAKINTLAAN